MTEEKAKTKWCPMVRAGTKGSNLHVAGNWQGNTITEIDEREYTRCVGSACMMWRWRAKPVNVGAPIGELHIVCWVPDNPTDGFCGLAGNPFESRP